MCSTHLLVGHSVVPPKEACSDEVCNHHIHSVMVMGQQDTENPHSTQCPAKPLVPPEPLGGICQSNKKKHTSRVNTPGTWIQLISINSREFSFTAKWAIQVSERQLVGGETLFIAKSSEELWIFCQTVPLFTSRCHCCVEKHSDTM